MEGLSVGYKSGCRGRKKNREGSMWSAEDYWRATVWLEGV